MSRRIELQSMLEKLLGSRNVYFQPPETLKINYPCIIYNLATIDVDQADDMNYICRKAYSVTYVDKNPDNTMVDELIKLPGCRFDRTYRSSNLNHYTFTLFY